jgi:hypothetical protein
MALIENQSFFKYGVFSVPSKTLPSKIDPKKPGG